MEKENQKTEKLNRELQIGLNLLYDDYIRAFGYAKGMKADHYAQVRRVQLGNDTSIIEARRIIEEGLTEIVCIGNQTYEFNNYRDDIASNPNNDVQRKCGIAVGNLPEVCFIIYRMQEKSLNPKEKFGRAKANLLSYVK